MLGIVVGVLALAGVRGPLDAIRNLLWGTSSGAPSSSPRSRPAAASSISEVALFIPCDFCWFQRIPMYPLSILTLLIAVRGDNRAARYLIRSRSSVRAPRSTTSCSNAG